MQWTSDCLGPRSLDFPVIFFCNKHLTSILTSSFMRLKPFGTAGTASTKSWSFLCGCNLPGHYSPQGRVTLPKGYQIVYASTFLSPAVCALKYFQLTTTHRSESWKKSKPQTNRFDHLFMTSKHRTPWPAQRKTRRFFGKLCQPHGWI